jgi:hypothetical protein
VNQLADLVDEVTAENVYLFNDVLEVHTSVYGGEGREVP